MSAAVRVDIDEFNDNFLPYPPYTSPCPAVNKKTFARLSDVSLMPAVDISNIFENIVKSKLKVHLSNMVFARSERLPDHTVVDPDLRIEIDAGLFHKSDVCNDKPHWADEIVSIHFVSTSPQGDPLGEDECEKEDVESRRDLRGRMEAYAKSIFAVQQRVALFTLLIIGREFRLLRWDRAGVIVTFAIDYVDNPHLLCDFFWRMSHLSDEGLGFDPSAIHLRAGDGDYILMDELKRDNPSDVDCADRILAEGELNGKVVYRYVRTMFRESIRPKWPRYKLQVSDGDTMREFLVCKPGHCPSEMAGRGTRGYVAYDCTGERFVWLKDTWRTPYPPVEKEGDTLKKLNKANVQNAPIFVCHGDVLNQKTVTADWWVKTHPRQCPAQAAGMSMTSSIGNLLAASSSDTTATHTLSGSSKRKRDYGNDRPCSPQRSEHPNDDDDPADCPLRCRSHYRLIVEEVAMPLERFENGRQLVSIVMDCLIAHRDAATHPDVNILHRDVCNGNVLIRPHEGTSSKGRILTLSGLLVDWEMSKRIHAVNVPFVSWQQERMGMWQTEPVRLLTHPFLQAELPDELESFFYVLLYNAARYVRSNCPDVGWFIHLFFDKYKYKSSGEAVPCGYVKQDSIVNGSIKCVEETDMRFGSPMDKIIIGLLKLFRSRYKILSFKEKQEQKIASIMPTRLAPSRSRYERPPAVLLPPLLYVPPDDETAALDTSPDPEERPPTAQDEENSAKLDSHEVMIGHLDYCAHLVGWIADKATSDQVPESWESRYKAMVPS